MPSLFEKNIKELKGVGNQRARLFEKLGAPTVGALLRCYPRAYEDWSSPLPIASAVPGETCAIRATVLRRPSEQRIRKGMTLYKVDVTDGVSDMKLTYFNNPYIMNQLKEGETYLFHGKVGGNFIKREMNVPDFAPASASLPIRPIYRLTDGLSNKIVINAVKAGLALLPEEIHDPIPEEILERYDLCGLRFALEQIHFPSSLREMETARRRLVFEELFVLQLGLMRLKSRGRVENPAVLRRDYTEEFYAMLPFTPTNAQKRAVREAMSDMAGAYPMSRLVQGDVGSGKTAVAAALCYSVVKNGMQAALMAPTEILAAQHFQSLSGLLAPAGVRLALLTGSLPAAKKREVQEGLKSGEIQFAVGTHALLSEGVVFQNLGLVVTDEQHRFGVAQRSALAGKGNHPHLLVMSATPIPRTLALIIYGDLDLSILDELPPGRQKIDTFVIDSAKRARAFRFLQQHIDRGRQCYIICPLIEEGQSDMASVESYAEDLRSRWFPRARVGVLHGRLKPKDKEAVMEQFADGNIDILVSTTVVEVGVDVPNAVIMLIENAERYGLSQLHQLRGRVGRGREKSYCILVSDAQNEEAVQRLRVMRQTSDGFRIADEDLKLRGPGDFFGAKQHGLPDLKIADMMTDMDVLTKAQESAKQVLQEDSTLERHKGLRAEVNRLFTQIGDESFN